MADPLKARRPVRGPRNLRVDRYSPEADSYVHHHLQLQYQY